MPEGFAGIGVDVKFSAVDLAQSNLVVDSDSGVDLGW